MKGRIQALAAGAALALYAAAGATAFGQTTPPSGGQGGPRRGAMMMHAQKTPAERAARLRDLLQLKPSQEPALQAFVSALDAAHRSMQSAMTSAMAGPAPQTTPERLDRMQQMMAQHQATMAAVIDATKRFYAQLDPVQKRAFDAMPMHHRMPLGIGGGMDGWDGMGGPGHMGGAGPKGGSPPAP